MKCVFVHSTKKEPYAVLLAAGLKNEETRTRNTLKGLAYETVAIAETGNGRPTVVGYVMFGAGQKMYYKAFRDHFQYHLVPRFSKYDCKPDGFKWVYTVLSCQECEPYPVPENAVRHGRVWCEW